MGKDTKAYIDKRLSQIEEDFHGIVHVTTRIVERIEKTQDDEFADLRQHIDHAFNRINYLEKKFLK